MFGKWQITVCFLQFTYFLVIQFSKLFNLVNKRGLTASFTKSRFGCTMNPCHELLNFVLPICIFFSNITPCDFRQVQHTLFIRLLPHHNNVQTTTVVVVVVHTHHGYIMGPTITWSTSIFQHFYLCISFSQNSKLLFTSSKIQCSHMYRQLSPGMGKSTSSKRRTPYL